MISYFCIPLPHVPTDAAHNGKLCANNSEVGSIGIDKEIDKDIDRYIFSEN